MFFQVVTHTHVPTPVAMVSPDSAFVCAKCGTFKKSGRLSCCAPGGAWYKNCGDVGDDNVDHAWLEGVTACECKLVRASLCVCVCVCVCV